MSKIARLDKYEQKIIEMLEHHLELATKGEIRTCAIVSTFEGDETSCSFARLDKATTNEVIGSVYILNNFLCDV